MTLHHRGNRSLRQSLIDDAKDKQILPIERGPDIAATVSEWVSENAAAIRDFNEFVMLNGLPLAKFRKF